MNPGIKVTLIGTAANLILSIIKFVGGIIGNSAALVADAVHSVSDLFTDVIVLIMLKVGQKPKMKITPMVTEKQKPLEQQLLDYSLFQLG